MTDQDEFFLPEEVDRQIERVSQFKEGDRIDAEAMAYLRSFYQADAQQEQETLDRIWNRIAHATPSEHYEQEYEKEIYMQDQQTQNSSMGRLRPQGPQRPRRSSLMQRRAPWALRTLWAQAAHTAVLSLLILHIYLFLILLFIVFRRSCMRNAVPDPIERLLLLLGIGLVKAA